MTRGLGSKSVYVLVIGALLFVAGCGGGIGPGSVRTSFVSFSPEQMQEISSNSDVPYRIQPDDVLKVGFMNNKDLDQEHVLVLPDGAISLNNLALLNVVEQEARTNIPVKPRSCAL